MTVLNKIKTLMIGSSLGQVISILTMPLIAHLYSKESIGEAALIISYVTIISSFVSLGYSNSIYYSKLKKYRESLVLLSTYFSFFVSIIIALPFLYFYLELPLLTCLVSGGVIFLSGFNASFLNIFTVRGGVDDIKDFNILQSALLNPIKIMLSFSPSYFSLILSQLIRDVIIVIRFKRQVVEVFFKGKKNKRCLAAFKSAGSFPLFNIPNVAINSISSFLPIITIGKLYDLSSIAIYELAAKFSTVLVLVIAGSLSSIYISEFIRRKESEQLGLRGYMLGFLRYILPASLFIVLAIYFFVPVFIGLFFPVSWVGAIDVIYLYLYYVPFLVFGTIYGRVFTVIGRQGIAMLWNLVKLILLVFAYFISEFKSLVFIEYAELLVYFLIISEVIRVGVIYYLIGDKFLYEK